LSKENNKFCLPIQKTSKAEVLKTISENQQNFAFFEVWLDCIKDLDLLFVDNLVKNLGSKLIVRFSRNQESLLPLQSKLELISKLENSPALLDLDVRIESSEIEHINSNNLPIRKILSYHNFDETPELSDLQEIYLDMCQSDGEIYKFACYCNSKGDALRLLSFQLELANSGTKHIVLGMGEEGVITRIFGSLWGNELVFAPLAPKEASAPGQLSYAELSQILEKL